MLPSSEYRQQNKTSLASQSCRILVLRTLYFQNRYKPVFLTKDKGIAYVMWNSWIERFVIVGGSKGLNFECLFCGEWFWKMMKFQWFLQKFPALFLSHTSGNTLWTWRFTLMLVVGRVIKKLLAAWRTSGWPVHLRRKFWT